MIPKYFDTDQHLIEPPDFWVGRFSGKFQDRAPKYRQVPGKGHGWSWDGGKSFRPMGLQSCGSGDPRKYSETTALEDLDPGCYDPRKRIEALDIDGAQAALLFPPSIPPAFFNALPDDEMYVECARAYNDAVLDWAAAGDAHRILPAAFLPMCSLEAATRELQRVTEMGFHHYLFNMYPSGKSLPQPEDEPFWEILEESGFVISMHGFRGGRRPTQVISPVSAPSSPGKPNQIMTAAGRGAGLGSTGLLAAFVFSGVMERFPALRAALIETSIGWLPYFAEQMDALWLRHRWSGESKLTHLPSQSLGRLYANFDREWLGVKHRDHIDSDRIVFGTDYPHIGSFYPHSRFYIELVFQGASAAVQEKILWSNAAKLYGVGG